MYPQLRSSVTAQNDFQLSFKSFYSKHFQAIVPMHSINNFAITSCSMSITLAYHTHVQYPQSTSFTITLDFST